MCFCLYVCICSYMHAYVRMHARAHIYILYIVRCFTIQIFFYGCSAKATDAYESARRKVAAFINASDSREIVFTRNATEAINLVAYSWGLSNLKPEDEVFSF